VAKAGTTQTDRDLLSDLTTRLRMTLPEPWLVSIDLGTRPGLFWGDPDATLTIEAPDGRSARLGVEVKPTFYPRDVSTMSSQLGGLWPAANRPAGRTGLRPGLAGWLLLSRFLTPRTRDMLADAGFAYADASGNVRIDIANPPMYLQLQGADTNPQRSEQSLQSLKGPGSSRVVRALVDFTPPYTLRDLADRAGLTLGTASRTISYLVDEALVTREGRGPIVDVAWQALIRRWAEDYSLLESNRSALYLEPRGPEALVERLPTLGQRYALTGSLAVPRDALVASPALAAVYVEDRDRAAATLGLQSVAGTGNVVLLEPAADVAFERVREEGSRPAVALSQVAVDLLTSPGRGPAEGDALLAWMEGNERAWRRP
jgi:hypothetical protein